MMASDVASTGVEAFPLDKIRMQKAIFLVAMRGSERLRGTYQFEPYNWGPYSGQLTSDLRLLVRQELLTVQSGLGRQHGDYSTTPAGERQLGAHGASSIQRSSGFSSR